MLRFYSVRSLLVLLTVVKKCTKSIFGQLCPMSYFCRTNQIILRAEQRFPLCRPIEAHPSHDVGNSISNEVEIKDTGSGNRRDCQVKGINRDKPPNKLKDPIRSSFMFTIWDLRVGILDLLYPDKPLVSEYGATDHCLTQETSISLELIASACLEGKQINSIWRCPNGQCGNSIWDRVQPSKKVNKRVIDCEIKSERINSDKRPNKLEIRARTYKRCLVWIGNICWSPSLVR